MWVKGEYHTNFDSAAAMARGASSAVINTPDDNNSDIIPAGTFDQIHWFQALQAGCMPEKPVLIPRAISGGQSLWLYLVQDSPAHFSSLSNWYSFHFRPVFTGIYEAESRLPLMIAIARRIKKQAATITLSPVPDADGSADLIADGFRKAGWLVAQSEATIKHSLALNGRDFAAYWADRPGEVRNTVSRKAKKGIVDIQIVTKFDADIWAAYEAIYAQSWKTAEGHPEFLKNFAQAEGKAGRLRMGLATIEGRPVAAQFWTVENGVANIHKLAHVEDTDKASPGTLLSHALFQHVIDIDKVTVIDFGTGDDGYKSAWMEQRTTLSRIKVYNPTHPKAWLPIAKHLLRRVAGRA
jgi:Acetyltransferase (GNAT) domain